MKTILLFLPFSYCQDLIANTFYLPEFIIILTTGIISLVLFGVGITLCLSPVKSVKVDVKGKPSPKVENVQKNKEKGKEKKSAENGKRGEDNGRCCHRP